VKETVKVFHVPFFASASIFLSVRKAFTAVLDRLVSNDE